MIFSLTICENLLFWSTLGHLTFLIVCPCVLKQLSHPSLLSFSSSKMCVSICILARSVLKIYFIFKFSLFTRLECIFSTYIRYYNFYEEQLSFIFLDSCGVGAQRYSKSLCSSQGKSATLSKSSTIVKSSALALSIASCKI